MTLKNENYFNYVILFLKLEKIFNYDIYTNKDKTIIENILRYQKSIHIGVNMTEVMKNIFVHVETMPAELQNEFAELWHNDIIEELAWQNETNYDNSKLEKLVSEALADYDKLIR
ncbi:MAG: hypothetical protein HW421_1433 [Ignavibacteria bacterium]|nr:hypothetical protein [Ignavibacteria bacterium]